MTRNSRLTRALLHIRGERSADDRDVARELRRALKRTERRKGDPQAVQVAGQPLEAKDYAHWRTRNLRRGALTFAPELEQGRYALVLFAIEPSTTEQFLCNRAGRHLMPPTVGSFDPLVEPAVALAGTLASWLDSFGRPVLLAPPLLYSNGRWRVAALELDWPLAAYGRAHR